MQGIDQRWACAAAVAFASNLFIVTSAFDLFRGGWPLNRPNEFVAGPPISRREYLASYSAESHHDVIGQTLNPDYFEGDIISFPSINQEDVGNRRSLQGMILWKDAIVPYTIENTFTPSERLVVARAFSEIEAVSCIKFIPKTDVEDSYVYLQKGKDCASHVGRLRQGQPVSLAPQCMSHGVVMHELLHALGFWHEQSRYDRQENPYYWLSDVGLPYDYDSILHYSSASFARNPSKDTITPKKDGVRIGQRDHLSKLNIESINALYGCSPKELDHNSIYTDPDYLDQVALGRELEDEGVCLDLGYLCWPSRIVGGCWWGDFLMRRYCRKTCGRCNH